MKLSPHTFFVSIPLPSYAKILYRELKKNHFSVYVVGGFVRDHLLGRKNGDIDFATNAHPEQVMRIFPKTIPVGIKHGTVMAMIEGKVSEITTYRSEGKYDDHRHPTTVSFLNTIEEDLKRRDFTINAFAYDCDKEEVIDCFGGREDLQKKNPSFDWRSYRAI